MRKIVVAAVMAILLVGMMISGTSAWKTQAQKEYKWWTEVEWTNFADVSMGHLTYGVKLNVPTKEISGVDSYAYDPEHFKENGDFRARVSYRLGGETYCFHVQVWGAKYFETISMRDKALENNLDRWENEWTSTGIDGYYSNWIYWEKGSPEIKNTTHMINKLFDTLAEEAVMEQLNESKIPNELKEGFKSTKYPLSTEAVVAQTGAEGYWYIFDGIEMYAVWKSEDQLNVWSCCKRIDIFLENKEDTEHGIYSYIIKGPVIFRLKCIGHDMIWDEMMKKYWEPMLRSFQPIVEIT